jgi:DNA-binding IclR family transcriptional regulator
MGGNITTAAVASSSVSVDRRRCGNSAVTAPDFSMAMTAVLIAQLAGLPVSTAHRLTSELASWQVLERTDDGRYRAGLALRMIGTAGHGGAPSLSERAPCVLEDLAAATKSRVRLGVLQNWRCPISRSVQGRRR